jgi:predicted RNase H-like nuclease (RuvC/YqgF family)
MKTLESGEEVCETVQYYKLPTLLLKVVKHQQDKIESLTSKNEAQQEEIEYLSTQYSQLKSDFDAFKVLVQNFMNQ